MKFALAVVVLAACGGGGSNGDADSGDTFIAFSSSFAPFRSWTHFHSDGPTEANCGMTPCPPNVLGAREQYISATPPSGSSEFPIGSMIVEVRASDGKIFAGAKRGGEFNSGGAKNWEFFELTENPVTIFWRGLGPPLGDTYGGDPNGCNTCHINCGSNNDYVCSAQLQLSSF
ncbi:MAG TPA: hypothetical protein VGO00_17840 [Kofleriaceae bacterium]|jgi:hypothetical protein|nr:hypothetical protein [Kofleriaceae bacterium]